MPTKARPKQTPKPKPKQTIPPDVLDVLLDALSGALVEDLKRKKLMDNGTHIDTIPKTPREESR